MEKFLKFQIHFSIVFKAHFGLDKNLDEKQILMSEAIYAHANKFMGFLGTIVDSLDDPSLHEGVITFKNL